MHQNTCPANATYLSKFTIAEQLKSISYCIEKQHLADLKSCQFFSLMADESVDVSTKEELSICGRWLKNGKAVEHFLGITYAQKVNAKALTSYLLKFLNDRGICLSKLRGLGLDGASTMSGKKNGVQVRMRCHSPSALFVHCCCHRLQLAEVHAANEHIEVKRVLGSLLTIWKSLHYLSKKAEKCRLCSMLQI